MLTLPETPLHKHVSSAGTLHVWRPAPTLMVTRVVGLLNDDGAAVLEAVLRRQAAEDGRYLVFHDWEEMTDYEPAARKRLTAAAMSTIKAMEAAHMLLRSKVVIFGVQIANIIIQKITVHPSRAAFERALEDALRQRRPR